MGTPAFPSQLVIPIPFQRLGIDWVGPLPKVTRHGQKYIPRFSEIAVPLSDLTGKELESSRWTLGCQQSFDRLKKAFMTGPVLSAPDYTCEFTIFTDASNDGLGVVLCQADGAGTLHPVMSISKKSQPREKHLSTIKKECFAIVWTLQRLKPYIWGHKFVLCTDHSPLLRM